MNAALPPLIRLALRAIHLLPHGEKGSPVGSGAMNVVPPLSSALSVVVATGLVPVVHAILRHPMDCRDKPGNDEAGGIVISAANGGSRFRGNDTVDLGDFQ